MDAPGRRCYLWKGMNRTLLICAGIGLAVALAFVGFLLVANKGAHMVLDGSIQKVRTQQLDENATAVVLDFRVTNPADYLYMVREVTVTMEDEAGKTLEGMVFPEIDARRLFEGYPVLGQKFNDTLKPKDKIEAKKAGDYMIAVKFDQSEAQFQKRKKLRLRIQEVNGLETTIEMPPAR